MKKNYTLQIFLLFLSYFTYGQNCTIQKAVSDDTICAGQTATIIVSGADAGITYEIRDGITVIDSQTPAVSGDLAFTATPATDTNYTIYNATDGCFYADLGVVTVNPIPNVNITNGNQTRCSGLISTMIVSGSVPGTTYNWVRDNTINVTGIAANGVGNISGTLTNTTLVNQTVTFTITPTSSNGCSGTPITASVTVYPIPDATASITSQAICTETSITPISFTSNMPGTIFNWTRNNTVNVTGIPNSGSGDISGSLTNNAATNQVVTFTIRPESTDGCFGSQITVTVTVYAKPIGNTSLPNQTKCSGFALTTFGITPATYSWTRNNTSNLTGNISGTNTTNPLTGLVLTNTTTVPQTTTITVTPKNAAGCTGETFEVYATINPTPNVTANITSQTICSGAAISPIAFSGNVTGTAFNWTVSGSGLDFSGLSTSPGDISGNIVNTTTTPRTATFTVTPNANGCGGSSTTVTVLVNPTPNATSASNTNQTICSGTNILPIVATQSVTGTLFSWTRNNTANVTGIAASGSFTSGQSISGSLANTTAVNQTVNFTITPTANSCPGTVINATIVVEPTSVGGTLSLTPVPAVPLNNVATTCHSSGTGTIYLTGERGTIIRWESSSDAGVNWTTINNTTNTYNYPNVTVSTLYRAIIKNGTCPQVASKVAVINVIPNIKPSPVTATPAIICNGDSSVLTSISGYATSGSLASGGTFNNSNPPGWAVGSCGNCLNAGSSNTNPNPWQLSATNGGTYSGVDYSSDNKFAIANGAFTSYLYTPFFNTYGLSSASLTFADSYNILAGASIAIQISVNNGPYTTIWSATGPATRLPSLNFHLNGRSIDLSEYLGQPNLRIRFAYIGNVGSSWAVDNIAIPEAPQNLTYNWIDPVSGQVIGNSSTITVTPTTTTTYAVASNLNGCLGFDDPSTPLPNTDGVAYITVTVNQRPTAIISQDQYVCFNSPASLTVHFTGSGPFRFTLNALNTVTNTSATTIYNNITPNASGDYTFNTPNLTATMIYSISALNDTKCTSITDDIDDSTVTVTVLNGTPGVWTGVVSTDWFDCKNWERGLPTATVDAVIPTTPAGGRMPVIDNASPYAAANSFIAIARNIIINVGARVSMDSLNVSTPNLHIKGDWRNSGRFYPGKGTVTFNSSVANFIQFMNTATENNFSEEYWNLTLNCTNGARGVITQNLFRLLVRNNLTLTSGDLRLTGEAQLVQKGTTANPSGGTGVLMRDQQGTKSSYHYNYWSSPVSPSGSGSYSIAGVLRDGTGVSAANQFTAAAFNKVPITFGVGYDFADGALTSPVKVSERWLYKYAATAPNYSSWQYIGSTGNIGVAEGFTMKGVTGTALNTDSQNYVFVGKPNNGTISLSIGVGQSYLVGNPYPSAINADEFIKDHIKAYTNPSGVANGGRAATNIINGAVYFWDHFGGYSHILGDYIGGYATYTLMGGVVAVSNDPLINNNNATGTKVPKKWIPVGQGFFVETTIDPLTAGSTGTSPVITGGTVSFKNSQREFKSESTANSVFFKTENAVAETDMDNRQKIRLSFESPSGIRRQLLVGADISTSNAFDIGYDAPMIDVNSEDMFWNISDGKFIIQAVQDFNPEQVLPLSFKSNTAGISKIKIDELENIPNTTEIYLHDNDTGIYHNLKNETVNLVLPMGDIYNRFSLRFMNTSLGNQEVDLNNGILIFADAHNILNIKNNLPNVRVEKVQLFNILGQSVAQWDVETEIQSEIKIPVEHVRSSTYIVKIITDKGSFSKQIIIR